MTQRILTNKQIALILAATILVVSAALIAIGKWYLIGTILGISSPLVPFLVKKYQPQTRRLIQLVTTLAMFPVMAGPVFLSVWMETRQAGVEMLIAMFWAEFLFAIMGLILYFGSTFESEA